jgi:PhzF family phenazine biosynthesis protein
MKMKEIELDARQTMTLIAGIIDVFATAPLNGNPLAVVEGGESLSDDTLRRLAGEFNQAETTFLLPSDRADRRLRSFSAAGVEIFGAGHNALGAWLWLGANGALGSLASPTTFHQQLGDTVLPITLEARGAQVFGRMQQSPLRLGSTLRVLGPLTEALGLPVDAVLLEPAPRVGETGAGHLLVRLRDAQHVDRAAPKADRLLAVLASVAAEGCYLYAFDAAQPTTAYARFFNPTIGLWEDAATGTAAGPLCAYLGASGLLGADQTLVIEQGTKLGRRSLLEVRLTPTPELSGTGVVVLRGELRLSR